MIAGTRACLSVATTLCNGDGVAAVLVVEIIKLGEVAGAHVRARVASFRYLPRSVLVGSRAL